VVGASSKAAGSRTSVLLVSSISSTLELDPATGQIGRQIANGLDGVVSPNRTRVAYVRETSPCPGDPAPTTAPEGSTTTSTMGETTTTAPGETTTTGAETTTTGAETTTTTGPILGCLANPDLLTADITGAGERAIVESVDDGVSRFSPDWSPDGSRILFTWNGPPGEGSGLAWVRPDGSGLEMLQGGAWRGTFSPDGRQIAYVNLFTNNLHVMNVATRQTRALTTDGTADAGSPPDWSPDGKRITYANFEHGVYVLDIRTRRADNLTLGWSAPVSSFETSVYSPDGSEIAFAALDSSALPEGEAVGRIYVVSASGGEPHAVADHSGRLTDWLRL
jgi:Dipeptidyl peptidase IV (DPP IV) N-terminal region/WD40-like Beta Propeller Repeat